MKPSKLLNWFSAYFTIVLGLLSIVFNQLSIKPGRMIMDSNVAVGFILSGFIFNLLKPVEISNIRKLFGQILAAGLVIYCLREWGKGLMAPGSGFCLIFLGLSFLLLQTRKPGVQLISQLFSLVVVLGSFSAIVINPYGLYNIKGVFTQGEALLFPKVRLVLFLLSLGILSVRPKWKLTSIFFSDYLGGKFLSQMSPKVIVSLLMLGILRIMNIQFGIWEDTGSLILEFLTSAIIFSILWSSSLDMDQIDRIHRKELDLRLDYEKLFNLSSDIICIVNANGSFNIANHTFKQVLGFNPAELLGKSFLEFVHPEDLAATDTTMSKLFEGVSSVNFENRYICSDNSYKVLGWSMSLAREEGLIFAVARDLSKSRKASEDIRRAYDFLEVVLDNVPNMIFVKDAKDLRFLRFNKAGEDLLGFGPQDLLGKNDYDLFPIEQASFFTEKDRMVLRGKKVLDIPEEPVQTKFRGERLLRTKKIPIYDQAGKAIYLLGISEDITEIKKLNEERERNEFLLKNVEHINKLIQYSLDAVVAINEEGSVVSWNSQAEKIFGRSPQEVMGQNLASLIIPAQYREKHKIGMEKFLATGIGPILNSRIEFTALRRGGEEFPVELAVIPIKDKFGWIFYAFVRDISDRKDFEQQQKARLDEEHEARKAAEQTLNMQDDFLSIAAHELKTPITPISMQLQLLQRTLSKESGADFSPMIKQNLLKLTSNSRSEVDRLARLIDELLDVSRISAGRLILNLEDVNLSQLIEAQIGRFSVVASKLGSLLTGHIQPNVIGHWDMVRLESLLENLISNAIKYGDGKPIDIKLEQKDKIVVIVVQDQGIGISPEDQTRIFHKFERAASLKHYSGLGLGLYITKEIAVAHGGTIRLESQLGKGSTFIVELPLRTLS